jgi:hypothetical protein
MFHPQNEFKSQTIEPQRIAAFNEAVLPEAARICRRAAGVCRPNAVYAMTSTKAPFPV